MSARNPSQTRHGLRPAVRATLTKTFLLDFFLLLMLPLAFSPLPGVAASTEVRDVHGSGSEVRDEIRFIRKRDDSELYNERNTTYGDVITDVTYSLGASENTPKVVVPTSENDPDFPPSLSASMKKHNDFWLEAILNSDYTRDHQNSSIPSGFQPVEEEEEDIISTEKEERKIRKKVFSNIAKSDLKPKNVDKSCMCGTYNSPSSRIVNGRETAPNQYPWMVSIQIKRDRFHNCGGTILSDWYVLTAAHCTDGWPPEDLIIRAGDHDLTADDVSRQKDIDVAEIIQHEDYNEFTTNNDISLLKLREPFQFTWRVNPVCLTPYDLTYYREKVEVMGWGKLNSKDEEGSPVLMQTTLRLLPMKSCRYNFKYASEDITSKMICGSGDKTDACQGDSGGPLVWRDETKDRYFIIGITSWGVGCAIPKYPGVFTKLSRFVDWVYSHTQDSTYCSSYSPTVSKKKKNKNKKNNVGNMNAKSKKKKPQKGRKSKGVSKKGGKKRKRKIWNGIKRRNRTKKKKKRKRKKTIKKKRSKKKEKRMHKRKQKQKAKRKKIRKKMRKKIRQKLGNSQNLRH